MNQDQPGPLEQLQALAAGSMGSAVIGIRQTEARSWRGFTMRLGELNLVFPFAGGFEILTEREIQPIPWATRWLRGITNVRGEVYTVVDFADFAGLPGVTSLRSATLLKLPDENIKSALLLERRVNLRSFSEYLAQVDDMELPPALAPAVSVVLEDGGERWVVLDVNALCRMATFRSIAGTPDTVH